jgi:hypothetical protein
LCQPLVRHTRLSVKIQRNAHDVGAPVPLSLPRCSESAKVVYVWRKVWNPTRFWIFAAFTAGRPYRRHRVSGQSGCLPFHRRRGKHPVCFAIVRTNQPQPEPETRQRSVEWYILCGSFRLGSTLDHPHN